MKRTQIYLEDRQADELAHRARTRGVTSSHVIREAIDKYLAEPEDEAERLARFRAAVDWVARHPIKRLPSGQEYVEELRRGDRARDEELEKRWRR